MPRNNLIVISWVHGFARPSVTKAKLGLVPQI